MCKLGDIVEVKFKKSPDAIYGIIVRFDLDYNLYDEKKLYATVLTRDGRVKLIETDAEDPTITVLSETNYIHDIFGAIEICEMKRKGLYSIHEKLEGIYDKYFIKEEEK